MPGSPSGPLVVVVDDQALMRDSMSETLRRAGYEVEAFQSPKRALARLEEAQAALVITDLRMPEMDGVAVLKACQALTPAPAVIVVTAHGTVANAVEAMKLGAADYLTKPFEAAELEVVAGRAVANSRLASERESFRAASEDRGGALVGDSPAMRSVRAQLEKVAPSDATLLIHGESGTGKEVAARLAHRLGPRRESPFLAVNCAALSAGLLESELFGHEKGAFTGAESTRQGRFELAADGTLLLDEVTEMDAHLQAKLLRVLQERSYERVGSSRPRRAEARVIATSNRDLAQAVRERRLREDLYYRLSVLAVRMPPLRERLQDVPALCRHFLARRGRRCGMGPGALKALESYAFPGNVRELENLVERAALLSDGAGVLGPEHFPLPAASGAGGGGEADVSGLVGLPLEEMERRLIEATLKRFGGERRRSAQALGLAERTLRDKILRYGLKEIQEVQA